MLNYYYFFTQVTAQSNNGFAVPISYSFLWEPSFSFANTWACFFQEENGMFVCVGENLLTLPQPAVFLLEKVTMELV